MESKDPPQSYYGGEKPAAPAYEGARAEGDPPTPPRGDPKESTALGEAADVYGNIEDAENLGYVERG